MIGKRTIHGNRHVAAALCAVRDEASGFDLIQATSRNGQAQVVAYHTRSIRFFFQYHGRSSGQVSPRDGYSLCDVGGQSSRRDTCNDTLQRLAFRNGNPVGACSAICNFHPCGSVYAGVFRVIVHVDHSWLIQHELVAVEIRFC